MTMSVSCPVGIVAEPETTVAIWLSELLSQRAIAVTLPDADGLENASGRAFQAVTPTGVEVEFTERSPVLGTAGSRCGETTYPPPDKWFLPVQFAVAEAELAEESGAAAVIVTAGAAFFFFFFFATAGEAAPSASSAASAATATSQRRPRIRSCSLPMEGDPIRSGPRLEAQKGVRWAKPGGPRGRFADGTWVDRRRFRRPDYLGR